MPHQRAGFTVLELLIAIGIIGVLASLMFPEVGALRERAERIVCTGHLRSLHVGLSSYLNDYEMWPQCPDGLDQDGKAQFWLDTLKDYGIQEKDWQCPTLSRIIATSAADTTTEAPKLHYQPSIFDANPMTPRKWLGMPWLIEIGDMHHCGNLMISTDGCVLPLSISSMLQAAQ